MVLVIMSKLGDKFVLCSLAMPELVGCAGGRCDKIAKIRVEGVVDKGDEDIWAKAWCQAAISTVLIMDGGGRGLEGIKFMHPCGGFCVLVS